MSIKSLSSALALSIAFTAGSFTASYAESPDGCNAGYEITRNQIGPEFPGGPSEMIMCISRNLHYPAEAYANHIEGRVVVQFVVTKTGAVGQVRVVRGVSPDLDAEAVRVVKLLPDFIPGTLNGEPVNVWMTLPIVFKIPEEIPSLVEDYPDQGTEEIRSMDDILADNAPDNNNIIISESRHEVVVINEPSEQDSNSEQIFYEAEQDPQFPGGLPGLMNFINDNLRYPAYAKANDIQGRVVVQFVVKKDGSIGQVKVVRKKNPDLDAEAVRVVKTLPKFIPGKMNGKPVNVWFTLPVTFKITE